jgi:hypothetical protein
MYGNQTMKMGAQSRRNERGYNLKKLWIGTSEGKVTRTIQYPVTSQWAKELDKTSGVKRLVIYICKLQCSGHRWLMENQGCDSRIKLRVSTRLYIMIVPSIRACALKSPVYCWRTRYRRHTGTCGPGRRAASSESVARYRDLGGCQCSFGQLLTYQNIAHTALPSQWA